MKSPVQKLDCDSLGTRLTLKMHKALGQLYKARQAAELVQRDQWEFAVEIQILREFGLDHSDLRSLICWGLVEHALELDRRPASRRKFRMTRGLSLRAASCFVLSESGLKVAERMAIVEHGLQARQQLPSLQGPHFRIVPVWDRDRRELKWGTLVVKRFRQPARNQETILAAFQEEGWPSRIDDPLSGRKGQEATDRLHQAIKKLNRQKIRLLRFLSDGAGQGVLWEPWAIGPGADHMQP